MFLLEVDGCTNYTVLSEADRTQENAEPPYDRTDLGLVTGWYRFQGVAGDRMPDKFVRRYHCGTTYPGWLNGVHPTVAEGVVLRTVCYDGGGVCGLFSNIIKVKNCRSYYVYELSRIFGYYCGNAGAGKFH